MTFCFSGIKVKTVPLLQSCTESSLFCKEKRSLAFLTSSGVGELRLGHECLRCRSASVGSRCMMMKLGKDQSGLFHAGHSQLPVLSNRSGPREKQKGRRVAALWRSALYWGFVQAPKWQLPYTARLLDRSATQGRMFYYENLRISSCSGCRSQSENKSTEALRCWCYDDCRCVVASQTTISCGLSGLLLGALSWIYLQFHFRLSLKNDLFMCCLIYPHCVKFWSWKMICEAYLKANTHDLSSDSWYMAAIFGHFTTLYNICFVSFLLNVGKRAVSTCSVPPDSCFKLFYSKCFVFVLGAYSAFEAAGVKQACFVR